MRPEIELSNHRYRILVVDDDPYVLESIALLLKRYGCSVVARGNAADALTQLQGEGVDIVLTDIRMPGMTGIDLLEKIHILNPDVPVILMTAYAELDTAINAVKKDAFDFILKPYKPEILIAAIEKAARYTRLIHLEKDYKKLLESTVLKRTQDLADALNMLTNLTQEIIQRLTAVAEFRDTDTREHISRISLFATRIADTLGMPHHFVEAIKSVSPLHDIGKIGIPDTILLKTERLSPEEFETMKSHTTIGEKMLAGSSHPAVQLAASIALNHHERWDGTGYPRGLREQEIPIEGRIVIICDQYDALRSRRPYKKPLSHEEVFKVITEGDGRTWPDHFDPAVLDAFIKLAPTFEEIFNAHQD